MKNLMLLPAPLLVYVSLLAALFLGGGVPAGQTLPIMLGLFALALAVSNVLLSLRPPKLVEMISLNALYMFHGISGSLLLLIALTHMLLQKNKTTLFRPPGP